MPEVLRLLLEVPRSASLTGLDGETAFLGSLGAKPSRYTLGNEKNDCPSTKKSY
jgi:hypothetical protein